MPIAPPPPSLAPFLPEELRTFVGLSRRQDVPIPPPEDDDKDDEQEADEPEIDDPFREPVVWRVGSTLLIEWRMNGLKSTLFGLGGLSVAAFLLAAVLLQPGLITWLPGGVGQALDSAVRLLPRLVFLLAAGVSGIVGVALAMLAVFANRHWRESVQIDKTSGKFILRWRAGLFLMYEYRYDLSAVRELRLTKSADAEDDQTDAWSLWEHVEAMWDSDGRLLFRYGAARVAFADGLSTRQATIVLTNLAQEAPAIVAVVDSPPSA